MAQIAAVLIFVVMFALIITEKFEKHYITLGAALCTIVFVFGLGLHSMDALVETLNYKPIFTMNFWHVTGEASESTSGINWATILFIAGMMVMVEGMAKAGFFRWLCMTIAKLVNYKVKAIFISFTIMSFILAMFIDSITVILFLSAVTVELAQLLNFNPIPMILSEIFCANLGGSATMCGDPPNIIIGTSLGYTFMDFVTNTGIIAVLALVLVVIYFYIFYRKELVADESIDTSSFPNPNSVIMDKKGFILSWIIFLTAIVMLVTHANTGLTVAFIGVFIAALTLICNYKYALELLSKVDYKTLLFFIGLFVVVGGLEQTGILVIIANVIGEISGGNLYVMIAIIIWVSGIASAFIDNIPFAATMVPVINSLAASQGIDLSILAWALAMGTDIGGSATPIGASANVVGTAVAAKEGYPISWGRYCISMVPATIIVLTVAMLSIWFRYV